MSQRGILTSLILATSVGGCSSGMLLVQEDHRVAPAARRTDFSVRPRFLTAMRSRALLPVGPPAASSLRVPPELWRSLTPLGPTRLLTPRDKAQLRLVVSIAERSLTAVLRGDTVFRAPVGVATRLRLAYGGRAWSFQTPRGDRRVLRKVADPVWTPPDWHYIEVAYEYGLQVARLPPSGVRLRKGARLVVRHHLVGLIYPGHAFAALPTDEHIVFDGKLFIPPVGTVNRHVSGELGDFALDLGGGYMIHGTWDDESVGQASTHGCIRVRDDDLVWLYENIPVGAQVQIR